ncbi:MAG TPA: GntR family transcriptional regulator, partial [Candidatus Saccharimonadales bacterium]|nr:GntR family transcriptional regulator [Candidatus Saccharimonadales bacterium]
MKRRPEAAARLDISSPVPLYHQIAEAIRDRIRSGDLAPGELLDPLRQAAGKWGVHLHTVRQAYASLARQGLVERRRGRGGTRVARRHAPEVVRDPRDVDRFLDRVLGEARELFGMHSRDLIEAMTDRFGPAAAERPVAFVVECSEWQCRCHAREIEERWNVDARTWPLTVQGEPPDATVVSTYLHYNDLRRLWPERLAEISFVTVRLDPSLLSRLADTEERILVLERDAYSAASVAADLRALFQGRPIQVEPLVEEHPGSVFPLE